MGTREPEQSLCRFFVLFWGIIGTLTSPEAEPAHESQEALLLSTSDSRRGITDALIQIAQILQNNQQHSSLYERVAVLEADMKLSLEKNKLLDRRIKELEKMLPVMNDKIEVSSNFLVKMESLEGSTNSLMQGFEEKLSTLAGEIVRVKSVQTTMLAKNNEPLSASPSRSTEGDKREPDTREVDKKKTNQIGNVPLADQNRRLNDEESTSGNASTYSSMRTHFGELREICPSAPTFPRNTSACLFTAERKLFNWTMANRFCQNHEATLASHSDIQLVSVGTKMKEKNTIFWISEISTKEFLEEKEKFLEENFKYFSDGSNEHVPVSNLKFIDVDNGKDNNSSHINILALDDNVPQSTFDNTSGLVDIRNLPHSEETDVNSERNVYMLNTEPDNHENSNRLPSLVAETDGNGGSHHIVKRTKEVIDSLSIPQDAVNFKEFLLLQPTEKDTGQDEPMSNGIGSDIRLSDSGSVDLLSLLTGESESVLPNRFNRNKVDNEMKKCPILCCAKGSTKCMVSLRLCSEMNSFWCKRNA